MIARASLHRLGFLGVVLLLFGAEPALATDQLVLIASVSSPASTLNAIDIQKLFLGLTIFLDGKELRPLRNESDESTRRIFYQDIIGMSEPTYERRLLAVTLQQGRTAPPVFRDSMSLLNAVAADPYAISYAWAKEVGRDRRIRILKVLGRE